MAVGATKVFADSYQIILTFSFLVRGPRKTPVGLSWMFCSTWMCTCGHLQWPARRPPAKAGRSRQLPPVGAAIQGPRAHSPPHALFLLCLHWERDPCPAAQLREMLHKSRGLPPGDLGMEKGIRGKCWGSPTRLERTQSMPATTSALSGVEHQYLHSPESPTPSA